MLWILITVALIALSYWFLIRPYKFWTDRGVKQGRIVPLFGDNLKSFFRQESLSEMVINVYNMFPKARYSGIYQLALPTLVVRDPELIKQITVKDFDHFVDHRPFISAESDALWAKNLFALTGQKWKDMRSTFSPVFTSSKMRYMFNLLVQNGERFINHFLKQDEQMITIEMRDISTRFTNDVIANIVFGVEIDSLGNRDNEFYLKGKGALDFSSLRVNLTFFGYMLFPRLFKFFNIGIFSASTRSFFRRLVSESIASRERYGIVRPDIINILMEARKSGFKSEDDEFVTDTGFATALESQAGKNGKKLDLTDDDIVSQVMLFFIGGLDTVSTLMCFMSYELAVNPDIQERLTQEVDDTLQACDNKITYEALMKMTYLDMVVSETARKWPNGVVLDRLCTKSYTIQPKSPDEVPIHLEKGTVLWLPIFGIHRDPQYYPDPERFDPERFNEENKYKIKPYTYFPFGIGPRNCIGSRFALMETKLLFFYILTKFKIVPVEKTQIPLKFNRKSITLDSENGFWLGLKRRVQ